MESGYCAPAPAENCARKNIMELSGSLFSLVERSESLKNLFTRGGIKLKWSVVVAAIVVAIVAFISSVYILMATAALFSANDKLCQTIAGNIASAESFITVEKKVLKRSLILQDMVSGLTRSEIPGMVHAAVYDLKGMLAERRFSYAAHSISTLRERRSRERPSASSWKCARRRR